MQPATSNETSPPGAAIGDVAQLQFSPIRDGAPLAIGTGFSARQFRFSDFPAGAMSPFVLVDHFEMWQPTFEVHPHAGMSAVTLVFENTEGLMTSRDSLGHEAAFGAGDLHWTMAGRGILHTQAPANHESRIHALQIFVNLPARLKATRPDSFRLAAAVIPEVRLAGVRVRVVAGEFGGCTSPAQTPEPVLMLDAHLMAPHESLLVPIPAGWNAWVLVVNGKASADGGGSLGAGQALCVSAAIRAGQLSLRTESSGHIIVLAGPRIDEPVVQHGPFVFESEASLAQALADLRAGHFGQVAAAGERTPDLKLQPFQGE